MKLKRWEIALIAAVIITVLCGSVLNVEANALSDKLIRLHVVANSDTGEDQELKLKVRDSILERLEKLLYGVSGKDEAQEIVEKNLDMLSSTAEKTISENGYDYTVKASICRESFPTTEYETFSLPAGIYSSLRIKIGEAKGHNWWCVVFPPVCTSASLADDSATIGLTDNQVFLMTAESGGYKVKFRALELIGELKALFV